MASKAGQFRHLRNEGFVCAHCGADVKPLTGGSSRNHCPYCLWSKHLDLIPGDRAAACGGAMEPIAVEQDARRDWMIVHHCTRCGKIRRNKAAIDDPVQPDSFEAMLELAKQSGTCKNLHKQRLGRTEDSRRPQGPGFVGRGADDALPGRVQTGLHGDDDMPA